MSTHDMTLEYYSNFYGSKSLALYFFRVHLIYVEAMRGWVLNL